MTAPTGPGGPDDPVGITRPPRPGSAGGRRNLGIAAAVLVCVVVAIGAFVLLGGENGQPVAARVTTTTTTTAAPTTAAPAPTGAVAPLTGVLLPLDQAERLARPAVAVKIDNDPAAAPQFGLGAADVVVELRVEGISRYVAVFHSNDVGTVGPVRSARTSDPDLLAVLGRPLVAWSGGNPNVVGVMRGTEWIQNLQYDVLPGAYRRERSRTAPHNLVVDVPRLWEAADAPVVAPKPVFEYRDLTVAPAGRPVAGFTVPVGNPSSFVWDAARGGWLRWSYGKRHTDDSGAQIAPANVVVLSTAYVDSAADRRSPEARTVGGGEAWVYTAGHLVHGAWFRPDRTAPWTLVDDAGQPIRLTPGPTWVELPQEGSGPAELDAATAQSLAAGP